MAARNKLFTAQLGQTLETQSKGERFTLVEPAELPLEPDSPDRTMLLAFFLILGLAGGLGWPQLAMTLDSAVRGPRSVQRIFGAPPIAEIPLIISEADTRRARRVRLAIVMSAPVLVIGVLTAFHFLIKPLDVFWYVTLRQFGM